MGSLKVFYNVGPSQNKVIDRDYKLAIKKVEIFGNQNLPDTFHNYDMSNNNFFNISMPCPLYYYNVGPSQNKVNDHDNNLVIKKFEKLWEINAYLIRSTIMTCPTTTFSFNVFLYFSMTARKTANRIRMGWIFQLKL